MKAIVHIGTEKTGTTTIQAFLHDNGRRLQKAGVAFPRIPGLRNHRKLAVFCMPDTRVDDQVMHLGIVSPEARGAWRKGFRQALDRELRNLPSEVSKVIFSSEHLHSRLRGEDDVAALRRLIEPYFDEITILVYLRRQDQLAVSLFSSKCRSGNTPKEVLDRSAAPDDHYYNYYDLVSRWGHVFGRDKVTVRRYGAEFFYNGDLLQDFMRACGCEFPQEAVLPTRLNERLARETQQALVLFNTHFPRFQAQTPSEISTALGNAITSSLQTRYHGEGLQPSRAEAREFYERFLPSNRRLALEFLSQPELFPDDFSMYPQAPSRAELPEEVFGHVLQAISDYLAQSVVIHRDKLVNAGERFDPAEILEMVAAPVRRSNPELCDLLEADARKLRRRSRYSSGIRRLAKRVMGLADAVGLKR